MPWVTVPIDGWKDHPDSPHLDGKPKIGDSSAHATSGVVSPNEPDTFLGGVLKSILSGDALSAGVQGAGGWIQGALADLPSSIVKGAYGTGKTISGLLQGDPETYKGMYQGTKDLANQVIDTTTHAGGRPREFGRMMGQMTGQPLVTEGIMRGGAINPARFEAPIPESVGALPESTLPVIDISPVHEQNQLSRIGNAPLELPSSSSPFGQRPSTIQAGESTGNVAQFESPGLRDSFSTEDLQGYLASGSLTPELRSQVENILRTRGIAPDPTVSLGTAGQLYPDQGWNWDNQFGSSPEDGSRSPYGPDYGITGDDNPDAPIISFPSSGLSLSDPNHPLNLPDSPFGQPSTLTPHSQTGQIAQFSNSIPPADDAELVNQSFDQMNQPPEQIQAPQQKTEAIQAAQNQMGQATQQSIPGGLSWQPDEAANIQEIQNQPTLGDLHQLHHNWYDRFVEAHNAVPRADDAANYAYRMMNTVNQRIEANPGLNHDVPLTDTSTPSANVTPPAEPETIPGGEASADDRNVDVQEINNATPERLHELQDEWHNRWRDAHLRRDTPLANYAGRMADLANERIQSTPETPIPDTPWQVSDIHGNVAANYATEEEAQQHLRDNPTSFMGYHDIRSSSSPGDWEFGDSQSTVEDPLAQHDWNEPITGGEPVNESTADSETVPFGRQLTRGQRADVRTIRNATTSTRLNDLYRQWNEEYQDARRYNDEPGMVHAREMAELIDERLTNDFNNVPGQSSTPSTPTPTAHPVDLGQLYHVYDQVDGSVIATFNTRYQAMNFVDEPGNEHLDIAVRGEVPPATGVRKKTLTELREATGVPNPPITFGKQDLSIVTDLTDAQIARLRGGAGRDKRIDVKGRKPKADRKVEDAGYDAMAKRALAATPTGDPGLTIEDQSYGGTHKRYQIIFRGTDGKAQALATVEENPDGWRQVPWLMADRTKGGKPAMYVMSAIAKMNATEQSGSISNHTANVIAQLTQRTDKLNARAARKAARLKREGSTETPPPPED